MQFVKETVEGLYTAEAAFIADLCNGIFCGQKKILCHGHAALQDIIRSRLLVKPLKAGRKHTLIQRKFLRQSIDIQFHFGKMIVNIDSALGDLLISFKADGAAINAADLIKQLAKPAFYIIHSHAAV